MPIDGFLKLDGIKGECKDSAHKGWINVTGLEWGMSQEASPGMDGTLKAGTPEVQQMKFSQPYGRGSIPMFMACANGRQIPSATFEACLPNGDSLHTYL